MAAPATLALLHLLLLSSAALVSAQAACYWHAGPAYRLPDSANVVPCDNNKISACCKLGDLCLAGNACYNFHTDDTYQYGCSDETYSDPSCPFKCGWDPNKSPWVALEWCQSFNGIDNTWTCQSPESCGCEWRSTYDLLELPVRGCQAMGSNARVAIYAPETLPAYLSLPKTSGGSTAYFSKGETAATPTAISGYTPSSVAPFTRESVAQKIIVYDAKATPASSYGTAVLPNGSQPPIPTTPTGPLSSSVPVQTTSNSGGTTSSSSNGQSTSSTAAADSGSSGSKSNSGGGLTTGAKVGLGVGIAGGVCLIAAIVLVALILRKRKARQHADEDYKHHSNGEMSTAAYYDPYHRGGPSPNMQEAPYTAQEEAVARKRMSPDGLPELDSGIPIHELESNNNSPHLTPVVGGPSSSSPRLQ